jgi:hypothetical protein
MWEIIYVLIILLLGWFILVRSKFEHLIVPGVKNRDETEATFLDDREWFDKAEKNFYSRYTS